MASFKVVEYGRYHKKTVFIFGGWIHRQSILLPVAKILQAKGYHCVVYTYNPLIVSTNYLRTVDNVQALVRHTTVTAADLHARGTTSIAVFGTSLGAMFAILAAQQSPYIGKLVLNLCAVDIVEWLWSWRVTRFVLKSGLFGKRISYDKLLQAWRPISFSYKMSNLKGRQALVYLSKKDRIMPFAQGSKLVHELQRNGCKTNTLISRKFGHIVAGIYNLSRPKVYLKFLQDK